MLSELVLLLGILILLLAQSFQVYHRILPMILLSLLLSVIVGQDQGLFSLLQALGVCITFWVIVFFEDKPASSVLLLLSLLGGMVSLQADNWLRLYVALELMAVPLYALTVLNSTHVLAKEAALKYFVMGSIGSVLFLFGISYVYLATGNLAWVGQVSFVDYYQIGWVLILSGIFIKLGLVPFHMWVPDIYQTIPLGALAWIAMVPKIVLLGILCRLMLLDDLSFLTDVLCYVTVLSVVYGAVMAVLQTNLRRLVGYASIAHLGIMMMPLMFFKLGFEASLFYLLVYIATNIPLFVCLQVFESLGIEDISQLSSIWSRKYDEAGLFTLVLISMTGIPPLAGFFAKFNVLSLLVSKAYYGVGLWILFSAAISGYYYMNLLRLMYAKVDNIKGLLHVGVFIYALPLMILTVFPNPFLVWLNNAIILL